MAAEVLSAHLLGNGMNETRLWCEVIRQAALDASYREFNPQPGVKKSWFVTESLKNRREARKWLTEDSPDFREVCSMAGLDARNLTQALKRFGIE